MGGNFFAELPAPGLTPAEVVEAAAAVAEPGLPLGDIGPEDDLEKDVF